MGLTLLGVASFALTWFVSTLLDDAKAPVRVQVEAPKSPGEAVQTIEPAAVIGGNAGMAGRNPANVPDPAPAP